MPAQVAGEPGPAQRFNDSVTQKCARARALARDRAGATDDACADPRCCGQLRRGMVLVSAGGEDLAGLTFAEVSSRLKMAPRPMTLVFRDMVVSTLRRQFHELQTRCV